MAFDDSSFLRPIWRLIVWVFIEFAYEILFQFLCFWVGRIVLLVITFGKYPDADQAQKDETLIGCFGMFVVFVLAILAYKYVL